MATTLDLTVADYQNPNHWYWRLTDAKGHFLADQEVNLNPSDAEYDGFLDLPTYLAVHAAPDRRRQDEARLVHNVGAWMGKHFYGPIDKILAEGTPAIVRVHIPENAAGLLYRPWELGHVQGRPLALQDVSLIFEVPGDPAPVKHLPVGDRLRILGVFSLPVDATALNLRQERYELRRTPHHRPAKLRHRPPRAAVRRHARGAEKDPRRRRGLGHHPLLGPRPRRPPHP